MGVAVRVDGVMVAVAAVAVVGLVVWFNRGKLLTAINPASPDNLAYSGVNAVGASLTGDKEFSLGSWIYDLLRPNEAERLGLK